MHMPFDDPAAGAKPVKPQAKPERKPSSVGRKPQGASTPTASGQGDSLATGALENYRNGQYAAAQNAYEGAKSQLEQALEAQLRAEEEARRQMIAAQQAAYHQNLEATDRYYQDIYTRQDQTYQRQLEGAKADFEAAMALHQRGYEQGTSTVQENTEKGLQQAYIAKMMAEKNLDQRLSAAGRSGGATETTLMNMSNQYGANRNALEMERSTQLAKLAMQLAQQQAQEQDEYSRRTQGYHDQYAQQRSAYETERAESLARYAQGLQQEVSRWDAQSLARKQGLHKQYMNHLGALERDLAQSKMRADQYYYQQLLETQRRASGRR